MVFFIQCIVDLKDYVGQISFFGGCCEDYDGLVIEIVLCEIEEEIGLVCQYIEVIGLLFDYFIGIGYWVMFVVGLIQLFFEVVGDLCEVVEIFEVLLVFFMDGLNYQCCLVELLVLVGWCSFYIMFYDCYFIWGVIVGMLCNLFYFLCSQ